MSMINAFTPSAAGRLPADDQALLARRDRVLGPAYRLFYETPLHIVRGEGVWLIDAQGRRYLDAYNNVASIGHCHPEVVEAIARQAAILNTHTRYLHQGAVAYAEALLEAFPADIGNLMLTCTGSEANDLALRIACTVTGGAGLIVTRLAYHGVTAAIAEASPSLGPSNPLGAHVWTVPAPPSASDQPDGASAFTSGVAEALDDMRARGVKPAALLVDTIFSSDGVYADPPGFLAPAVDLVRRAGGLFIADEVQAGFGRVGERMWGFARHGLSPDLVTMGKPMGNGHPVAGVAMRREHAAAFGAAVRYFNTFGGNPVSCAAAMAVLTVIRRDGLAENSSAIGVQIRDRIRELSARRPLVWEVRGDGLFIGVELRREGKPAPQETGRVVNAMRELGVLLSATGPAANVLKIRPPLVFRAEHVDILVGALGEALDAI